MGTLMLVNPKGRRRVKRKANPAGAKRKAPRRTRRSNPFHAVAPARRRARRHNPVKHHRSRRRNPISAGSKMVLMTNLKNALAGASGGLALDVIYGYVGSKLPMSLQTGAMRHVAKLAIAFGAGYALSKTRMIKGPMLVRGVEGAMTVTLHDALRGFVSSNMPSVKLGEYVPLAGDDDLDFLNLDGRIIDNSMGEYVPLAGASDVDFITYDDLGNYDEVGDLSAQLFPTPYTV